MEDIRSKTNKFYSNALLAMEQNKDPSIVRELLFKTIECLQLISISNPELKKKSEEKIKFLLEQCKIIREDKSCFRAYKNLTGNELNFKVKEEIKVKEEPKEEIKVKEEVETEKDVDTKNCDNLNPNDGAEENSDSISKKDDIVLEKPQENNESKSQKIEFEKPVIKEKETKNIYKFNWDSTPLVSFDDVAGLKDVKEEVFKKVILPLTHPELYEGYDKKNGGGLLLYGAPGTGKTMIAAAIAKEIGAKFCCIGPSDLLSTGVGNTEKAISKLFEEARSFKCAIVFFDEVEALCPAVTHAQVARQVRSELLRQMQGLDSYGKNTGNILYLIAATNKPWDIDPAFVRPGRFGTRVYVSLPDPEARKYMIESKLSKINSSGKVAIDENIDIDSIILKTEGFNGADLSYLLDEVQELSIERTRTSGEKIILNDDFMKALEKITSSVQQKDIEKILEWKGANG